MFHVSIKADKREQDWKCGTKSRITRLPKVLYLTWVGSWRMYVVLFPTEKSVSHLQIGRQKEKRLSAHLPSVIGWTCLRTPRFSGDCLLTCLHVYFCERAEIALVCQMSLKCWVRRQTSKRRTPSSKHSLSLRPVVSSAHTKMNSARSGHITSGQLTEAKCSKEPKNGYYD